MPGIHFFKTLLHVSTFQIDISRLCEMTDAALSKSTRFFIYFLIFYLLFFKQMTTMTTPGDDYIK